MKYNTFLKKCFLFDNFLLLGRSMMTQIYDVCIYIYDIDDIGTV